MFRVIEIKVKTNIDFDEIEKQVGKAAEQATAELMNGAKERWHQLVGQNLRSLADMYNDAIQAEQINETEFRLYLQHTDDRENKVVNMIEGGAPGWDMTRTHIHMKNRASTHWSPLASGDRANQPKPRTRALPYIDVPFREGGRRKAEVSFFRRMSGTSQGWKHPGFRPEGSGGLKRPLREMVAEYIEEEAPKQMKAALRSLKVTV